MDHAIAVSVTDVVAHMHTHHAHAPRTRTTHAHHARAPRTRTTHTHTAGAAFVLRAPPAQTTASPASCAGRTAPCPPSPSPTARRREESSRTSPGYCLHTHSAAPAKSVWVRGFARAHAPWHYSAESGVATSRTDGQADPTAKSRPMPTRLSR